MPILELINLAGSTKSVPYFGCHSMPLQSQEKGDRRFDNRDYCGDYLDAIGSHFYCTRTLPELQEDTCCHFVGGNCCENTRVSTSIWNYTPGFHLTTGYRHHPDTNSAPEYTQLPGTNRIYSHNRFKIRLEISGTD